jgi:putative peptidoglycan lipid II flippase
MSGKGFLRSTGIVGSMTLLSRITGLVREMVLARTFGGSSGVIDAFLIAWQIPNYLRRLFAEGAFSQAFVPVVAEYRVRQSQEETRELVDSVAGTLGGILAVASLVGVLVAPLLVLLFAPGFRHDLPKFDLTVEMLRFTFPYLLFVSLTALAGGVLNSHGRFAMPALSTTLLNVIGIVVAAFIAPRTPNPGLTLAIGVFVAGIAQLAFLVPPLAMLGLVRRPRWNAQHEGVRRIGSLMLPAILGSSMGQIGLVLNSVIASFLVSGSIAWLNWADRLVEFPLGVFSIALATVILPSLSSHHAEAAPGRFSATLDWALRLVCLIVVPAAVALFALAGPLTVVIFHYGAFVATDVSMTATALRAFSIALFGWSCIKVLAPGYFARQDTRTPMRTALYGLGLNMGLNVVYVLVLLSMGKLDAPGTHVGLALTNGIGALCNAWLLYRGLRRPGVYQPGTGWVALRWQVAGASLAMGLFLAWAGGDLVTWLDRTAFERVGAMAGCVAGGGALYFAVLWLLGARVWHFRMQVPGKP